MNRRLSIFGKSFGRRRIDATGVTCKEQVGENGKATAVQRPIFVFSSGWRTGSTLVQRILCSHPEIHIWGENHGVVGILQQAHEEIAGLQHLAERHTAEFERHGTNGWLAMMNPPQSCFSDGLRALLEMYLREPALQLGAIRWGFKEVRHGSGTARFLHRLYPEARFLFLVRHPADCLASARATGTPFLKKGLLADIGGATGFLEHWTQLAASFLEPWDDAVGMRLKYEDLVTSPEETIQRVGGFLDADPDAFDLGVLEVRRRGWLGRRPRLTGDDRRSLETEELWAVAGQYGYTNR
jgi:hypothetical protein